MAFDSLFAALSIRPEIARSLAAHLREVNAGSVPPRTKELIALMVAWLNACDYCTCVHEEIAAHVGVDTETLAQLGEFARSDRFSPAERAVLSATVALTREPRALPPALREELSAHYEAGEIVEIVSAIALYNGISRLSNALGIDATPPAPVR